MLLSCVTGGADWTGEASADAGAFLFLLDRFRTGTSLTALTLFLVLDNLPALAPLAPPAHQAVVPVWTWHGHVSGTGT